MLQQLDLERDELKSVLLNFVDVSLSRSIPKRKKCHNIEFESKHFSILITAKAIFAGMP